MNIIFKEINIQIINVIKYLMFLTHCVQYVWDSFIKYINRGVWHPIDQSNRNIAVGFEYIFIYFNKDRFRFRIKVS